jgi:hypothetical protein
MKHHKPNFICRNIYWTDSMKKRIAVALDDGRYMKTLISEHLGYPQSIAVSPKLGYGVRTWLAFDGPWPCV